jgi:hypothetical protein
MDNDDPFFSGFCNDFLDWCDAAARCTYTRDFSDRKFVFLTNKLRWLLRIPAYRHVLERLAADENAPPEFRLYARAALFAATAPDDDLDSLWRAAAWRDTPAPAPTRPRPRGRPSRGSPAGQQKVEAALLTHHRYENGSVLNWEPATIAALAKLAGVSTSTASRWLASIFGADKGEGYERYRAACQSELLAGVLTGLAEPLRLARCIAGADVAADSRRITRRRR